MPSFQLQEVDPSSVFCTPFNANGISLLNGRDGLRWTLVMSDSEGPVERLNSKSTLGCNCKAFRFEVAGLFRLCTFSEPRWRVKSSSISIEDSSSFSLAEDMAVQAVAELPLLSEELVERPSPRDREEPTLWPMHLSTKSHFLLVPLEEDM